YTETARRCGMRTAARATFVGSIALVVALTASAQAEQGTIWVFGTGTKSCGQFVQVADSEHKAKPRHTAPEAISTLGYVSFVTWTEGFYPAPISVNMRWSALALVITLLMQWHGLKTTVVSTRSIATSTQ